MVNKWLFNIQNFFFPGFCLVCQRQTASGRDLCHFCTDKLPVNYNACRCCALPLPGTSGPDALCGKCQHHRQPFRRVIAPYRYEDEIRQLHQAFKFSRKLAAGELLAGLLADSVSVSGAALPELLIPVPLHASRLRERGFNQSMELARCISKQLEIPVDQHCIRRNRRTAPQSGLTRRERMKNVRGAFSLHRPVRASHIAIIDDVMTTGQTVVQLANLLVRSGVENIDVWVIARRP